MTSEFKQWLQVDEGTEKCCCWWGKFGGGFSGRRFYLRRPTSHSFTVVICRQRSQQRVCNRLGAIEGASGDTEGIYTRWNPEMTGLSVDVRSEVDQADNRDEQGVSVNNEHAAVL